MYIVYVFPIFLYAIRKTKIYLFNVLEYLVFSMFMVGFNALAGVMR